MSDLAKRIWLVGATSSLAEALLHALAKRQPNAVPEFVLSGRDEEQLQQIAADITARYGAKVSLLPLDFLQPDFDPSALASAAGSIDECYMLAGYMGQEGEEVAAQLPAIVQCNLTAPAQLLECVGDAMAQRGQGLVVAVSSVAGDRGRASNYPYGSAKAGLTAFASGLRNKLVKSGVYVMTVKPGFVDTPMTWSMPSPLIASRSAVAKAILRAASKQRNVVYVPWFWRFIMMIICAIPEKIFKRLSL